MRRSSSTEIGTWAVSLAAATVLARAATLSAAEDPARVTVAAEERRNLVSLPVLALHLGSVALQAERYLGPTREWSAAASLGLRSAAGGDYGSLTLALGGEGRWFFHRPSHGTGVFAAARFDVAHLWVRDEGADRDLPGTWSLAASSLIGWRWLLWRRLEITPEIGLVAYVDLPAGRLVAQSRLSGTIGLTVGWLF